MVDEDGDDGALPAADLDDDDNLVSFTTASNGGTPHAAAGSDATKGFGGNDVATPTGNDVAGSVRATKGDIPLSDLSKDK